MLMIACVLCTWGSITAGGAIIKVADLSVKLVENDVAGFTVTSTGNGVVQEAGEADTYTVQLNTEPLNPVTIEVTAPEPLVANPATLTFSASSWNKPQTVTISAPDDQKLTGSRQKTITHT